VNNDRHISPLRYCIHPQGFRVPPGCQFPQPPGSLSLGRTQSKESRTDRTTFPQSLDVRHLNLSSLILALTMRFSTDSRDVTHHCGICCLSNADSKHQRMCSIPRKLAPNHVCEPIYFFMPTVIPTNINTKFWACSCHAFSSHQGSYWVVLVLWWPREIHQLVSTSSVTKKDSRDPNV